MVKNLLASTGDIICSLDCAPAFESVACSGWHGGRNSISSYFTIRISGGGISRHIGYSVSSVLVISDRIRCRFDSSNKSKGRRIRASRCTIVYSNTNAYCIWSTSCARRSFVYSLSSSNRSWEIEGISSRVIFAR